MMNTKPQVLCWLMCDGVHIDPATGKHTLLGVFSAIRGRQFPLTHPFMIWFLTLSDVPAGKHKIRISLGLDHTQLTFRHSGRDFRLTDVHGRVIESWFA
jgi:hypothetical protein